MMSSYKLTLRKNFPGDRRNRGGVSIPVGADGVVVDLDEKKDADALKALKNDPEITVTKLSKKAVASESKEEVTDSAASAESKQLVDEQDEKTA